MALLPIAIEQFVKAQKTIAIAKLWKADEELTSPYGSYWYRAVAAMLLSGRVAAKTNGAANMTDVNRICKEANFNQYLFERIARFLVAAKVVRPDLQGNYSQGENHVAFWKHRRKELTEIVREAVLQLSLSYSDSLLWRPESTRELFLIEFLILFFTCFQNKAVREEQIGQLMHEFSELPRRDLEQVAKSVGVKKDHVVCERWEHWLDEKGQKALLSALYAAEWAYYAEREKEGWVMPSPMGLAFLGIGALPNVAPLIKDLKADSNRAVFAGAGLDFDKLVPFFRFCKIKRIDQIIEFQVDPKRLKEIPSSGEELRAALAGLDPLPSSLVAALQTKSCLGGKIGVRYCSALVKPETSEAAAAIRQHPQLKGYLEPGAPLGFLLVKSNSNPDNFIRRCKTLGFEIESL